LFAGVPITLFHPISNLFTVTPELNDVTFPENLALEQDNIVLVVEGKIIEQFFNFVTSIPVTSPILVPELEVFGPLTANLEDDDVLV
jgi:hypothetical protein